MNFVEPIRDRNKIEEIKKYLEKKGDIRTLLMFVGGINFALRIQDLLKLKVKDVYGEDGVNNFFYILEGKTKKKNKIFITDAVKKVLKEYMIKYPFVCLDTENYLFFKTRAERKGSEAIGRRQALNIIYKIMEDTGVSCKGYGTHTLRKTWAYHARKNDVPLEIIQRKLNHSSMRVTEKYLGIETQEIEKACLDLNL